MKTVCVYIEIQNIKVIWKTGQTRKNWQIQTFSTNRMSEKKLMSFKENGGLLLVLLLALPPNWMTVVYSAM